MVNTRFVNANGLFSENQATSARDMALLARRLLDEFPAETAIFAIPAIRVGETVHHNYNLLLERFAGADGMKTGFVCASGYNIVASATRGGRQLIAVVFGAFSQAERAEMAARLLLEGFARADGPQLDTLAPKEAPAPARNLRATMCSEQARKQRYDPAPGDAVIRSPYLEERRVAGEPLVVALGGADAEPTAEAVAAKLQPQPKIPIPTRRPARASEGG
jgi:D-alanyl-D-alanine carboxypeptidase